jgi:hypothetical protein
MPSAEFEPTITEMKRLKIYASDLLATVYERATGQI